MCHRYTLRQGCPSYRKSDLRRRKGCNEQYSSSLRLPRFYTECRSAHRAHRKYTAKSRRSSVFRPTAARSHTDTALSRRPPFFQGADRQRRIYMCLTAALLTACAQAVSKATSRTDKHIIMVRFI